MDPVSSSCARKARRGRRSLHRAHAQRDRGLGEAGGQGEAFSWLTKASSTVLHGWMACMFACRRPIHCVTQSVFVLRFLVLYGSNFVGTVSHRRVFFLRGYILFGRIPSFYHRCHADPCMTTHLLGVLLLCICVFCILLLMIRTFTCSRLPFFQHFRPTSTRLHVVSTEAFRRSWRSNIL